MNNFNGDLRPFLGCEDLSIKTQEEINLLINDSQTRDDVSKVAPTSSSEWYRYSDSYFCEIKLKEVLQKNAYMLFYVRID